MDEPLPAWEVPDLIAQLDPGIAGRIAAGHPLDGWCRSCGATAPCSMRTLAAAVDRVIGPDDRPPDLHC